LRSDKSSESAIQRRIVGFHQDEERHWVADLECGHTQHVRHDPPMQTRPWVLTGAGRASFIGQALLCVECVRKKKSPITI
jgi:hypothetical protein